MASSHTRIALKHNASFKRSGIKSYARALLKYGFNPTKPGPYGWSSNVQHQGKFAGATSRIGGRTQIVPSKLIKRPVSAAATGGAASATQTGDVPATDVQQDSEYICPVAIGTPAQTLNLDFDTGSADLWVWSTQLPADTTSQYGADHTIFDPTKSSTFNNTSQYTWKISYGDGSSASGTVGTDVVDLGGVKVTNQAVELANNLSTEFQSGAGDGLLGLAWSSINTVSPHSVQTVVSNMILQNDIPKGAELFTAHLSTYKDSSDNSFYTFGYIDQDVLKSANATADQIAYTAIDNSQGFWQFTSTSAKVNDQTIALPGNTAIADTGTTLALVSDDVCEAIYKAIPGAKYDDQQQGWVFPTSTSTDSFPTVQFAVGDNLFTVNKEDLGYADVGDGNTYGGVQSRGSMTFDILGDTFLKASTFRV